jgi:sugar lactone lactonase YvrE
MLLVTTQAIGQHMYMRKVNPENGPMAHEVYNVFQESKHYIWFSSDGGIWRYDGKNYKSYTTANGMPDNVAFGFVEDNKKRLWIKTYNNKLAYILDDKIYNLPCSKKLSQLTKTKVISAMHINPSGSVFLAYFRYNNIIKIDYPYTDKNIKTIPINSVTTNFIYVTSDGGVLAGSNFYSYEQRPPPGVTLQQGKSRKIIPFVSSFNDGPRVICKKQEDGTYLLGFSNLLARYKDGKITMLAGYENPILNAITDRQKNTWVITAGDGLLFFNNKDEKFQKPVRYLSNLFPNSITQDEEGSYWITTMHNGIYYAPHNEIQLLNDKNGLFTGIYYSCYDSAENSVSCFHNEVLFKISSNLAIKQNTTLEKKDTKNEFNEILKIDATNFLFIGTQSLVYNKTRNKAEKLMASGMNWCSITHACLVGDTVYGINQDLLYIFDPDQRKNIPFFELGTKARSIAPLDAHTILISCENGLVRFNTTSRSKKLIGILPANTGVAGVVRSQLFSKQLVIALKSGEIYFANDELTQVNKIVTSLRGLSIKQVITDEKGRVWIATNKGICRINENLKISYIDKFHGFPTNLVNHIAFGNGKVFVSTEEGLVIFPADKTFFNSSPPDLYTTDLSINGENRKLATKYNLNYDENYIKINFQALNFITGDHTTYHYKITGIDNRWHTTASNTLEFAGLQPGNYNFLLFATTTDGVKSRQTLSFSFNIFPPFWKTWWFILLIIAFSISITLLFFFIRIKQIKKREAEKNELIRKIGLTEMQALRSQMNPHFIFNSMNSIQHYVLNNDPLTANRYLSKFSKLMRNVLEHSRQEHVLLEQELEIVRAYLEIESLRFEDKFSWVIHLGKNVVPQKLVVPPMIIQPFIENALWHGLMTKKGEQKLLVNIYLESNQLCIEVEDNGIGRVASEKLNTNKKDKESLGMKITKERLDLMENIHNVKAETVIVDKIDHNNDSGGTKAIIKIPLLKN